MEYGWNDGDRYSVRLRDENGVTVDCRLAKRWRVKMYPSRDKMYPSRDRGGGVPDGVVRNRRGGPALGAAGAGAGALRRLGQVPLR